MYKNRKKNTAKKNKLVSARMIKLNVLLIVLLIVVVIHLFFRRIFYAGVVTAVAIALLVYATNIECSVGSSSLKIQPNTTKEAVPALPNNNVVASSAN